MKSAEAEVLRVHLPFIFHGIDEQDVYWRRCKLVERHAETIRRGARKGYQEDPGCGAV
jgi:hypothetical protein